MHEKTQTRPAGNPQAPSSPASNETAADATAQGKQFASQLALEVMRSHQITVAGKCVENLTPRFSLCSGNTRRETCWRQSGMLEVTDVQK